MDDAFKALARKYRRDELHLPAEARRLVDAIGDILRASMVIRDLEKQAHHHVVRRRDPLAVARGRFEELPEPCHLEAPINNRWTLFVLSYRTMLPDAESLVNWAAAKLAVYLPVRSAEDDPAAPPTGGGGGSGGSAEVGIPVWWARKVRN